MRKKKIMLVFGTRPEAIKMCPLVHEFRSHSDKCDVIVCVTGQHREMLDQVLGVFDVVPDYDLALMTPQQTLFDVTCGVLLGLKSILEREEPDVVLVHGDTTTSFSASLACFYLQIPIGHVEAGLRTWDVNSPWPEEFNRQAVDIVSDFYFAPTEQAKRNLLNEGKPLDRIFVTGNTGIDALKTTVFSEYESDLLDWAEGSRLVLVTAHRRENLGKTLRAMCRAIRRVVEEHPDVKAIYPAHLNPEVRSVACQELGSCKRLRIVEPLEVVDFHNVMAKSYLILTDSGGVQEEAPSLGKPVLVMRDTTERPEGVEAGTLMLAGTTEDGLYKRFAQLLDNEELYEAMARASNPYGDGCASRRIAQVIVETGFAK